MNTTTTTTTARNNVGRRSEPASPDPVVGMGAYIIGYSDRYSCTIIEVSKNGKQITVQHDTAELVNGVNSGEDDALHFSPGGFCGHTSGVQRWKLTPNPEGKIERFSLRRGGQWVLVGDKVRGGRRCAIGERYHHYDFNF